ncbi:MAG: outer membrane lipoprotein-sorting protein [Ignavibacteria bacterium]|nr:outer membrane lipoprotein-sorting protein [Ignavibacteria bacterium]
MIHRILSVVILFGTLGFSQLKNPETILENVKKEFDKIEDYQVDVKIKVDVDFLKMPEREATIFYKKPDKFHIDSENFALLPKSGLNSSPLGFLNYDYKAYYIREDTVNGAITSVIKVIPLEVSADVILSTFWVDTQRNIILKVESTRKPQGTFFIDMEYLKTKQGFWLPSSMTFSFTVDRSLYPGKLNKDNDSESGKSKEDSSEKETGYVYLNYSNYKVNIGLQDELFEDKNEKK